MIYLIAGSLGSWLKTIKKSLWEKWMENILEEPTALKEWTALMHFPAIHNSFPVASWDSVH